MESAQHNDGIRELQIDPDFDGRECEMVTVRYDLDTQGLGMVGSQAEDAEHRAGTTARDLIQRLVDEDVNGICSLAIYAYVPTQDGGSSVSTKVVVDLERYQDVDWSAYPWQNLRDDADQYKFNESLYN